MNDVNDKIDSVNLNNKTSARAVKILAGTLIVVAAATAIAFYLLFTARSDINELYSKQGKLESFSKSSSSKESIDIKEVRDRVKRIEGQVKAEESKASKAKNEFDPDKPFGDGDVSVTSMLKTIDLNAETANKNFDKIQTEVPRLKDQLDEEKQVAGD